MARSDAKKTALLQDMMVEAKDVVTQSKFVLIERLHQHLAKTFAKRLAVYPNKLRGKNRTEADNLIDWVKAHLTMGIDPAIVKIDDHYCWLPSAGSVKGIGTIVSKSDVCVLARAFFAAG